MKCPNCSEEMVEGKCPSCGTVVIIGDTTPTESTEIQQNEDITPPETRVSVNSVTVLLAIVMIIILVGAMVTPGIPFYIVIAFGIILFLCVCAIFSNISEVYSITCPYCNKEIEIPTDTNALDCPVCNERIIIENYTPKKK